MFQCFVIVFLQRHFFKPQTNEILISHLIHQEIRLLISKMDFYKLSQEDFHVLEEKFTENNDLLTKKDSVSGNISIRYLKCS